MIVSINQPAYLPWLGYFDRIMRSDLHVVLDHVQFEKNSFINRNKVRTKEGWCWLTVPINSKGRFGDLPINKTTITDDRRWARKHHETFKMSYAKAAYFDRHREFIDECYQRDWSGLVELIQFQTAYLFAALEITTPVLLSSALGVTGQKDELVLNICRATGATEYLSGALGVQYLRESLFTDSGISVSYQHYEHPTYRQAFPGFEPYMCAFDLIFNEGPAAARILSGGATNTNATKSTCET